MSGILVEVEGVNLQLRAEEAEEPEKPRQTSGSSNPRSTLAAKGVKAYRPRSPHPLVHDPGGVKAVNEVDPNVVRGGEAETLPSPNDLAQSFLQHEAPGAKAEMQAAISKSRYLNGSQVLGESVEEDPATGFANKLTLPAFVAGFIKGVGDRLELRVRGVTIDLELRLNIPLQSSALSGIPENITLRLSVNDIDFGAAAKVDSPGYNLASFRNCDDAWSQQSRRIYLRDIKGAIIADDSVFANLSSPVLPSSPQVEHKTEVRKKTPMPQFESSPMPSPTSSDTDPAMTQSTIFQPAEEELMESSDMMDSLALSENDEATSHGHGYQRRSPGIPIKSTIRISSRYQDQSGGSFFSNHNHRDFDLNIEDSDTLPVAPKRRDPLVQDNVPDRITPQSIDTPAINRDERKAQMLPTKQSKGRSGQRTPVPEDLMQSKIFSHEEAESMYMSATSRALDYDSASGSPEIPGAWRTTSSDEESFGIGTSKKGLKTGKVDAAPAAVDTASIILNDLLPNNPQDLVETDRSPNLNAPQAVEPPVGPPGLGPDSASGSPTISESSSPQRKDTASQKFAASSNHSERVLVIQKLLMSIDTLDVYLPQEDTIGEDGDLQTAESYDKIQTRDRLPEVFSGCGSLEHGKSSASDARDSNIGASNSNYIRHTDRLKSIQIGQLKASTDIGLTRLAVVLIQKFMVIFKPTTDTEREVPRDDSALSEATLCIGEISWKFLDLVKGFTYPATENQNSFLKPPSAGKQTDAEILLMSTVRDLKFKYESGDGSFKSRLSVGKAVFGYVSQNILSFDSGLKMRESTRDILAPINDDVDMTFVHTNGVTKIHLTTLPLHITLDLRRLDETFSWFGGFSSMLDFGSSMMSTVTVIDNKSQGSKVARLHRGVHFEPTIGAALDGGERISQGKVTARVGGILFDLQGASCGLRIESTAMKVVSRTEGIGLQVDKVNFTGPYFKGEDENPSLNARLVNIRMEYLSTPKEVDLTRLLALLSPSKDKYEQDDDILLDTLLRQRRQGGIVRVTLESVFGEVTSLHDLQYLPSLGEELKKLSTVTKYLPQDDRPGLLTLGLVRDFKFQIDVEEYLGRIMVDAQDCEMAHVTFPSLVAFGIRGIKSFRNNIEELLGEALTTEHGEETRLPMIMARFIGNEMEPMVKIKLWNVRVEYHVSTIMAMMGISEEVTAEDIVYDMVKTVGDLTKHQQDKKPPVQLSSHVSSASESSSSGSKNIRLDIDIRDCIIGLNPRNSPARGLVVLTNTRFDGVVAKEDDARATLEIKKASFMIINDTQHVLKADDSTRHSPDGYLKESLLEGNRDQIQRLSALGYVSVNYMSAAKIVALMARSTEGEDRTIDIEIRDELFLLESCADSTQTLLDILNGLKPPVPPSTEPKYRTEIIPVEDMLASLSGNAFVTEPSRLEEGEELLSDINEGEAEDEGTSPNMEFVSSLYASDSDSDSEQMSRSIAESMLDDNLESIASPPAIQAPDEKPLLESFQEQYGVASGDEPLHFREDHFSASSAIGGTAHRWNIKNNTYGLTNQSRVRGCPLKVCMRDVHIIWNLFDGYDWQDTRDTISQAVTNVEIEAAERLANKGRRASSKMEEEEDTVIGDFLFNSIYIGIPANHDPKELTRRVNRDLEDLASESESYATSTTSGSPSRQGQMPRTKRKRLRLQRSKHHKLAFELKGISADLVVYPPGLGQTCSSIDIRVHDLEIFDHVPTSTWKKFATYMHDAGERESGTSMIHLEILNVKPVATLAATEMILKV